MRQRTLVACVLACAILAHASPVLAKAPPKPPMIEVVLEEQKPPLDSGKAAIYEGRADAAGVAFYIKNTNIQTPAAVVLEAGEPGPPMTMQLKNDFSTEWDRTVRTGEDGLAIARFRTEGPTVVLVKSAGDMQSFRLGVWVGQELKFHTVATATPFVTPAKYQAGHGGGWLRHWPWLLALLGVAAGGVAVQRLRRRRTP
ncbi:hypothetical protein [Myxococcus sp. RHSTA-1-4]|uniref:hypothetical protein n=1 Tax=Myxococcus sp. RHSTA-1-4 TaxID=2874601 RepID=UPI001CBB6065|nr:hypothetical protein [Myxococcus sp. RHSTA-1-4]MBZ4421279.1 hypothetical protein [Myxococcus sp. RHSTA-1-4]